MLPDLEPRPCRVFFWRMAGQWSAQPKLLDSQHFRADAEPERRSTLNCSAIEESCSGCGCSESGWATTYSAAGLTGAQRSLERFELRHVFVLKSTSIQRDMQ
ncbi:hypothetical protein NGR_c14250 [Sinorhizobium fredii NGR234]|uniref:Uncharacterized protein n=1 Tax=Sinorhizobium fredii (strain NBRC 101917 / NGR234) TaxID=394 RepID=C3MCB9_SINFN|nr:hypothetical protein NGR_c14250 [Sinorhizobium fredii NGR234]